jgi:hypothetical protein
MVRRMRGLQKLIELMGHKLAAGQARPRASERAESVNLAGSLPGAAATDADIEVQPVLGRFALRYHLEPDPRPATAGIDDAVRAGAQLILRHSEVSPVGTGPPALQAA